jgi:hypothetical protein
MYIFSRMRQLRTPWMAWWLVLALVVAPALGRMHEVLHAPGLPQIHAAAGQIHSHGIDDLFGEHSALECLVLDQLSHGHDGPAIYLHLWQAAPHSLPVWSAGPEHLPTALALFQARAPPRVSS